MDLKHQRTVVHDGQTITIINRPKGFGDTIEKLLHTGAIGKIVHRITGMDKPCGPCLKRKQFLNNVAPYKKKESNG